MDTAAIAPNSTLAMGNRDWQTPIVLHAIAIGTLPSWAIAD
jgi:hypothetical protein